MRPCTPPVIGITVEGWPSTPTIASYFIHFHHRYRSSDCTRSIFMWYGAVCPWSSFAHTDVIPVYRLIFLGVLILLFRRIPEIFAMHLHIAQIEQTRQALFVGFFGPIGVSAIFYLYVSLEFLRGVAVDGEVREDAARLEEVMTVVIWFLAICSIVKKFFNCIFYVHHAKPHISGCPRSQRSDWQTRPKYSPNPEQDNVDKCG